MNNFLGFLFFLVLSNAFAENTFILDENTAGKIPKEYLSVLVDPTSSLKKWQLKDSDFKFGPEHVLETNPNTSHTYWYRFKVTNNSNSDNWLIEFHDPHITDIVLFEGNTQLSIPTGSINNFSSKEYDHKNFVFDLHLKQNETKTYYVKLKSNYHSYFGFVLVNHNRFTNYALNEYYYLGLFYGILSILAIYNLFLYFSFKENTYLYYVAYIGSAALHTFTEDGLGFQFVWPSLPALNYWVDYISFPLLLITFLLYSNSFIELKENEPRIRKWIILSTVFYLVSYVAFTLFLDKHPTIYIIYMIPYLLTYYASIKIYKKGNKQARFFVIGFAIILLSFFIFFLRVYIGLSGNVFTVYIFNFGFIIEAVMLSYALGDKIKITKEKSEQAQQKVIQELERNEKLKDKVNRELEEKVRERTVELYDKTQALTEANKELEELKDKLYIMNSELDKSNWRLQKEIKEVTKSKILSKTVSFEDFSNIFPDNLSCLKHLEKLKWDEGFKCKKCGHLNYSKTQKPFLRKCSSCKHPESVTANTLFHAVKFPLNKAFFIAYITCDNQRKITVDELSETLDLRRNTAWGFKKKVEAKIESHTDSGVYKIGESWEKIIF